MERRPSWEADSRSATKNNHVRKSRSHPTKLFKKTVLIVCESQMVSCGQDFQQKFFTHFLYASMRAVYRVLILVAFVDVITSGGEQIMKLLVMKFSRGDISQRYVTEETRVSHSYAFINRQFSGDYSMWRHAVW
jgi:hypothetical protein